mmetsp:Transcript_27878/g.34609  ORF Transcript_27878/g.34609 Transcript_27878/m.34609 type:complete len:86 (-) Transcript_27878:3944-4201(-)
MDGSFALSNFIDFACFILEHLAHTSTILFQFRHFRCQAPILESKFFDQLITPLYTVVGFRNSLPVTVQLTNPSEFVFLLGGSDLE